jgi:hypothetical protein
VPQATSTQTTSSMAVSNQNVLARQGACAWQAQLIWQYLPLRGRHLKKMSTAPQLSSSSNCHPTNAGIDTFSCACHAQVPSRQATSFKLCAGVLHGFPMCCSNPPAEFALRSLGVAEQGGSISIAWFLRCLNP